jgi:hypothetical protein
MTNTTETVETTTNFSSLALEHIPTEGRTLAVTQELNNIDHSIDQLIDHLYNFTYLQCKNADAGFLNQQDLVAQQADYKKALNELITKTLEAHFDRLAGSKQSTLLLSMYYTDILA